MTDETLVNLVVTKLIRNGRDKRIHLNNMEEEDLTQEGFIALLKARKTFEKDKGVKFETYASKIINNRIIDILRTQKNNENNYGIDADAFSGNDLQARFNEISIYSGVLNVINTKCSEIEKLIFSSFINGYSYKEIESKLSINKKKIDNTIQKVRRLTKEELLPRNNIIHAAKQNLVLNGN
ncbi:MAG: sigma-70 family RNA polymerase sigma factor [Christensenellaceae bacterium]|jgi:RNA polymerase sporulation-specific sigma factor|nr:sigma-70 family RNA polymerase sigma factor [Christensenellaceae bacterium]